MPDRLSNPVWDEAAPPLEALHGLHGSRLAYESHQAAIEQVGRIAQGGGHRLRLSGPGWVPLLA